MPTYRAARRRIRVGVTWSRTIRKYRIWHVVDQEIWWGIQHRFFVIRLFPVTEFQNRITMVPILAPVPGLVWLD
jgi:hypothetical protein